MVDVKVCMGTHCSLMGSLNLYEDIEELQKDFPEEISLEAVTCLDICKTEKAPVISINNELVTHAKSEEVIASIREMIEA